MPAMLKQIIFIVVLLITLLIFAYSARRLWLLFRLTKPAAPVRDFRKRINLTFKVAFGQSKILNKPGIGLLHALVFWGFLVITIGSFEMVVDGVLGLERSIRFLGGFYDVITASGDVFSCIILIGIVVFLFRRLFLSIKRFNGIELSGENKADANIALSFILLLMVSLIVMNVFYVYTHPIEYSGTFPVSEKIAGMLYLSVENGELLHEISWWSHILLIFVFANYLPYSKHFHVFMSVPNVFFSNLHQLTYLPSIASVTSEVKAMLENNYSEQDVEPERFGVKDIEDVTWKNYMDALTCTQCGRCTEVCPANITGKKLSPRKVFVDLRARMNQKGPQLFKNKEYDDGKALTKDFISLEELWACTTCNACAEVCPLNISHPNLIIDMRRYLVMELGEAPTELNAMFSNIENNGAPWQFSPEDRLNWVDE
jgi:heterodisulfide reductase subunit C/nitrate reductase gamma subunit